MTKGDRALTNVSETTIYEFVEWFQHNPVIQEKLGAHTETGDGSRIYFLTCFMMTCPRGQWLLDIKSMVGGLLARGCNVLKYLQELMAMRNALNGPQKERLKAWISIYAGLELTPTGEESTHTTFVLPPNNQTLDPRPRDAETRSPIQRRLQSRLAQRAGGSSATSSQSPDRADRTASQMSTPKSQARGMQDQATQSTGHGASRSPTSYSYIELIDRACSSNSNPQEIEQFQNWYLERPGFRRAVENHKPSSRQSRKRLETLVRTVMESPPNPAQQGHSEASPAMSRVDQSPKSSPRNSPKSSPRTTEWVTEWTRKCQQATTETLLQRDAVLKACKISSAVEASDRYQKALRVMRLKAREHIDEAIQTTFLDSGSAEVPTSTTVAVEALRSLHRAYAQLAETQILAGMGEKGQHQAAEAAIAKVADEMGGLTVLPSRPRPTKPPSKSR